VEVAHAPLAGVEGAEPVYLVTAIAGEDEPYLGLGHGTPAEDAALLVVVIVVPLVFVSVGIVARVRTGSGVGHRILGIIAIGIGFAVPRLPALTLAVIVLFVGAAWLVSSILETVEAVTDRDAHHRGPPALGGIISAIAGLIMILAPGLGGSPRGRALPLVFVS